jgi:cobalamin-dependent methionine synthase I
MSIKAKDNLVVYGMIGIFLMTAVTAIVTLYGAGKMEFLANSLTGLQSLTSSLDKLVEFFPNLLEKLGEVVSGAAGNIVDNVTPP